MVTVYDKKGNPIELDGCDARERVNGGLATYEDPNAEKAKKAPAEQKAVVDMTMPQMKKELKAAGVQVERTDDKYALQAKIEASRASKE